MIAGCIIKSFGPHLIDFKFRFFSLFVFSSAVVNKNLIVIHNVPHLHSLMSSRSMACNLDVYAELQILFYCGKKRKESKYKACSASNNVATLSVSQKD